MSCKDRCRDLQPNDSEFKLICLAYKLQFKRQVNYLLGYICYSNNTEFFTDLTHYESRKVKKGSFFYRSCLAKICYTLNNVVTACPVSSSLSISEINLLENTFDTTLRC